MILPFCSMDAPILYVEDEPTDIYLLKLAFVRAGITHPLQTVEDGKQAIDYLDGAGSYADRALYPIPRLVLLDLNLPFKSGFEVLQWVRHHPKLCHLIVLIYSSSNQPEDIHTAYQLGANGYLVKPSGFDKLLKAMIALRDYWLVRNSIAKAEQREK